MAEGAEPQGQATNRMYRVLALLPSEAGDELVWADFGEHPGRTQDQALDAAEAKRPNLKGALVDVAIPAGDFNPRARRPKTTYVREPITTDELGAFIANEPQEEPPDAKPE